MFQFLFIFIPSELFTCLFLHHAKKNVGEIPRQIQFEEEKIDIILGGDPGSLERSLVFPFSPMKKDLSDMIHTVLLFFELFNKLKDELIEVYVMCV
ncbi:hypothetical protein BpHYR1_052591 [Brachionus plicatilis]|uniref:Uncharacterized protein n=1 Tax=Brachionus plicatilis TaxID=10195 RepID=A0A3M7S4P6_BRAPC|nr:hypothetical protein BpHYR1_052591 [Brachionus plicatilis]